MSTEESVDFLGAAPRAADARVMWLCAKVGCLVRRLLLVGALAVGFLLIGVATGVAHADSDSSHSGGSTAKKINSTVDKAVKTASSKTGKSHGDSSTAGSSSKSPSDAAVTDRQRSAPKRQAKSNSSDKTTSSRSASTAAAKTRAEPKSSSLATTSKPSAPARRSSTSTSTRSAVANATDVADRALSGDTRARVAQGPTPASTRPTHNAPEKPGAGPVQAARKTMAAPAAVLRTSTVAPVRAATAPVPAAIAPMRVATVPARVTAVPAAAATVPMRAATAASTRGPAATTPTVFGVAPTETALRQVASAAVGATRPDDSPAIVSAVTRSAMTATAASSAVRSLPQVHALSAPSTALVAVTSRVTAPITTLSPVLAAPRTVTAAVTPLIGAAGLSAPRVAAILPALHVDRAVDGVLTVANPVVQRVTAAPLIGSAAHLAAPVTEPIARVSTAVSPIAGPGAYAAPAGRPDASAVGVAAQPAARPSTGVDAPAAAPVAAQATATAPAAVAPAPPVAPTAASASASAVAASSVAVAASAVARVVCLDAALVGDSPGSPATLTQPRGDRARPSRPGTPVGSGSPGRSDQAPGAPVGPGPSAGSAGTALPVAVVGDLFAGLLIGVALWGATRNRRLTWWFPEVVVGPD